jgi:adenylosuccinate lyase
VDIAAALNPLHFVGRAPEQVDEFLAEVVEPIRSRYAAAPVTSAEVKV